MAAMRPREAVALLLMLDFTSRLNSTGTCGAQKLDPRSWPPRAFDVKSPVLGAAPQQGVADSGVA
jgi:hypothetical protein